MQLPGSPEYSLCFRNDRLRKTYVTAPDSCTGEQIMRQTQLVGGRILTMFPLPWVIARSSRIFKRISLTVS